MRVKVRNAGKRVPESLVKACNGNKILAQVFFNRGINSGERLQKFLGYTEYRPYQPLEFPKMKEACELIIEAIAKKEKIAVYGDYDADGITATSVLVNGLRYFGANVVYHVPDRFAEGYGMNSEVVKQLHEENVSLIITCDCGISNFEEIKTAKALGMNVVLTDHHTIGESIPEADFVINPKLLGEGHPIRMISGCGVAYLLIKALGILLNDDISDNFLDLVALSIISDVIPLHDESRYLFVKGFSKLMNGERVGMSALLGNLSSSVKSADDIGFYVAPQINAVGRMDNAKLAVELFLTEDEEKAKEIAETIRQFNVDRKNIQAEIHEQAKKQVEEEKKNKKILILYGENWHHGIIGIVAGKICEEYHKPCIVLSLKEDGEIIVGSARSIEGINIYQLLSKFQDDLVKFGGHAEAAGLSLNANMLSKFTEDLEQYADVYFDIDPEKEVTVDMELKFSDVKEDLLKALESGEPYGAEFPSPAFVTQNARVATEKISGLHHFLTLVDSEGNEIGTTLWNYGTEALLDKKCTVVYSIYLDTYRDRNEVKIKISDLSFEPVEMIQNKVKWIDCRNMDLDKVMEEFPMYKVFYEGPQMCKPNVETIDSNYFGDEQGIILSSLPRDTGVLEKITTNTNCEKIIINYSYLPKYDWNGYLKMFLGIVKMAINQRNSKISVKELADVLLVEKEFVLLCLKVYAKHGYFSYQFEEDEILFSATEKEPVADHYLEGLVANYLSEKQEYVNFMNTVPIGEEERN